MKRASLSLVLVAAVAVGACDPNVGYLNAGSGGSVDSSGSAGQPANEGGSSGNGGSAETVAGGPNAMAGGGTGGVEIPSEAGSAGEASDEPKVTLRTRDGQILPESNDFGIDGEVRKYAADPELLTETHDGDKTCVSGTLVGVSNMNYDRYWGGGIQVALKQSKAGGPGVVYDATAHGVAGFRLTVDGVNLPKIIRLQYKNIKNTDSYCREVNTTASKTFDFMIRDALKDCWAPGGAAISPTELENIELHIVPPLDQNVMIDFCLTAITVIPTPR